MCLVGAYSFVLMVVSILVGGGWMAPSVVCQDCKNGFNRWLDNTYSVQKYMVKKLNCNSSQCQKLLEMTDDLDYL